MQITFIRHLATEWNKKQKLQGRQDLNILPITETDKEKILLNKQKLETFSPFDYVLASTLKRTKQTAKLYGYDPKIDPLLDELDFGPFEGLSKKHIFLTYGTIWFEQPSYLFLGEPIARLEERIKAFLNKYKDGENILAFGHGSWIRAFLSYHQFGHINEMNKITVENNDCITIQIKSLET